MQIDLNKKYHIRYFHTVYALEAFKGVEGRVLDVGCGRGEFTSEIKKARPQLAMYGCDIDANLLNYLKKHFKKEKIIITQCDAHDLPYTNETFDAVLMFDVLEHLNDPERSLSEISRVLKSGGVFHLVVPCEAGLHTLDGWIKKLFGKNLKEVPIGHIQQLTLEEVKEKIEKAGFKVKKIEFSYYFLYQFFSLLYFSFVAVFRKGKYLALGINSRQGFLDKIIFGLKVLGGWLVYFESSILSSMRGQTAHITSIKK